MIRPLSMAPGLHLRHAKRHRLVRSRKSIWTGPSMGHISTLFDVAITSRAVARIR